MTQSYQQTSALSVAMFAAKSIRFYLLLIFVASPDISSSTRVNKTVSDGKVFITGDHNEVVLSSARETKLELAEIKNKLKLLSEGNDVLTRNLKALDQRILPSDEIPGKIDALNKTIEGIGMNLELVKKSNVDLFKLIHAMKLRLTGLEKHGKISFISWYRSDYWMPLHCNGLLLTTCKHYLLKNTVIVRFSFAKFPEFKFKRRSTLWVPHGLDCRDVCFQSYFWPNEAFHRLYWTTLVIGWKSINRILTAGVASNPISCTALITVIICASWKIVSLLSAASWVVILSFSRLKKICLWSCVVCS